MAAKAAERFDVAVVGAGPVGLVAAGLMARVGAATVLIGPAGGARDDARSTALFVGSMRLMDRLGAGEAVRRAGAPLAVMRIVDRTAGGDYPSVIDFSAAEIGEADFGTNVPNPTLVAALEDAAAAAGAMRLALPVTEAECGVDEVRLVAEGGRTVHARLALGAEGRHSGLRAAAGIAATRWDYNQTAIALRIGHERPHENVSTEFHRRAGPFTTVPLPGRRSAVVWLERPRQAQRLLALDRDELAKVMEAETMGRLGRLDVEGRIGAFPVIGLKAASLARRRVALAGEAAHVIPPIGAQGLNLGLRDAAEIAGLVAEALAAGGDPGAPRLLSEYERRRRGDVLARRAATDLLNRSLLLEPGALGALRGLGLVLVASLAPARRALMRAGLVRERDLPALMRGPAAPPPYPKSSAAVIGRTP